MIRKIETDKKQQEQCDYREKNPNAMLNMSPRFLFQFPSSYAIL